MDQAATFEASSDTSEFMGLAYFDNEDAADDGKDDPSERSYMHIYHLPGQAKKLPVALSMAYHYQHRGRELWDMSSLVYNLTISRIVVAHGMRA